MRLADAAWNDVDTTTIRNCWRKAGILPDMDPTPPTQPSVPISSLLHDSFAQTDPVAHAERQVEEALDELVATGALQTENRMDIDSLLNPAGESDVLTETSDQEIYEAVVDAIRARENVDINGGDDVDNDPIEPLPMRRDVLMAVSTIEKYTNDLNDPMARKIEALLGSFNRQLHLEESRGMKDVVLTNFFKRSYIDATLDRILKTGLHFPLYCKLAVLFFSDFFWFFCNFSSLLLAYFPKHITPHTLGHPLRGMC